MPRPKREPQQQVSQADSLVGQAEALLKQEIVTGVLAPGARLAVQELAARYGIGATPIREALSRLSSIGHVRVIDNRGFRVAPLSRRDLEDLISVRQVLEAEALRRAMAVGGADWEGGIVAALHKLERTSSRLAAAPGGAPGEVKDWVLALDDEHRGFHDALLAACGSARLLHMQAIYYDQTFRYRVAMLHRLPNLDVFVTEHRRLAQLVLDRKPEAPNELALHLARPISETEQDLPP